MTVAVGYGSTWGRQTAGDRDVGRFETFSDHVPPARCVRSRFRRNARGTADLAGAAVFYRLSFTDIKVFPRPITVAVVARLLPPYKYKRFYC